MLSLGSKMEIHLRAKPTHYMNIYDGTNKTKPKEIAQCLFQGACFLDEGPVVPVIIPGQALLLGLLEQRNT